MVLPRILTALAAAPFLLWVIYLGSLPFAAFVFFVVMLSFWEFHVMAERGGYEHQGRWGMAAGAALALSMIFPGIVTDPKVTKSVAAVVSHPFTAQVPAVILFVITAGLVFREMARHDKRHAMLRLATTFLGLLLVVWPLGHLILLRELRSASAFHAGRDVTFFLVFLIWAQDTAAWAAGKSFGKRRLSPVISPKKSWEGAAAGLAAAILVGVVFREARLKEIFSLGETILLAASLGVLAQVSDLAESLMKRCFDVKDSSQLLPGHGGVLDRFDSFLFSTPFLYFYMIFTGKVF